MTNESNRVSDAFEAFMSDAPEFAQASAEPRQRDSFSRGVAQEERGDS